jgi:hypothetical protein
VTAHAAGRDWTEVGLRHLNVTRRDMSVTQ